MARTLKSDLSSGPIHFGNGSSIISPSFPLLDMGKFSRVSDFTINPPNVRIDADLKKIVARDSEKLRYKVLKDLKNESDWELNKVLKLTDGAKDSAKSRLARDGKSAVISEVSKSINASSIDHSSRYLLSSEPLYVYGLSYAIHQEKVDDAEGINDRILVVIENKIKTYFNKQLAKKFIQDRHIELTKEQKKQIMQAAASTNISYLQGEPAKALGKIVAKYVDYGDLNLLVDKFFEDGPIDPEKGTPQIRQLMIKYLVDIGLTVSKSDLPPGPSVSGGGSSATSGMSGFGPSASGFGSFGSSRPSPSTEKRREPGAGKSGSSAETVPPKESASELARKISEMDISAKKEGSANPAAPTEDPKSPKSAK